MNVSLVKVDISALLTDWDFYIIMRHIVGTTTWELEQGEVLSLTNYLGSKLTAASIYIPSPECYNASVSEILS